MRLFLLLLCVLCCRSIGGAAESPSIARIWNEETLSAIRIDLPHPPVHARNLFHLSIAMYDAWAAYEPSATGYLYHGKHTSPNTETARREAISFAAYRILSSRYSLSRSATNTAAVLASRMTSLGYSANFTSTNTSTPAGLGNHIAELLSSYFISDGARELHAYRDALPAEGGYAPVNPPLKPENAGTSATNINRWQPLLISNALGQNGLPVESLQSFLGSQWHHVRPFALMRTNPALPWLDPGPQPLLNGTGHDRFMEEIIELIRCSSQLTPNDGQVLDISPGILGNNSVGQNDGRGHALNPFTGNPYATALVRRGDFARVLAEYWADGPQSETPPGHWNALANHVSYHDQFERRIAGTGPIVSQLEWDVKLYFALNGALHDAACAAWTIKRHYDGVRPITAVRHMGQLGQSSDPSHPTYHPQGLPLVPGLIELVTEESSAFGQRHAGYPIGHLLIYSWLGQPPQPQTQYSGCDWIYPDQWVPYQRKTFVSPAFPGYISGHSTFSRAAAEVLAAFTGSHFFPGGIATHGIPASTYLVHEFGPAEAVPLQWATYFDAADQAGLSRIWGGIHFSADDLAGRRAGSECGLQAWALARKYFDGSIARVSAQLSFQFTTPGNLSLVVPAYRGIQYQVESTSDLSAGFTEISSPIRATETTASFSDSLNSSQKFYRVRTLFLP